MCWFIALSLGKITFCSTFYNFLPCITFQLASNRFSSDCHCLVSSSSSLMMILQWSLMTLLLMWELLVLHDLNLLKFGKKFKKTIFNWFSSDLFIETLKEMNLKIKLFCPFGSFVFLFLQTMTDRHRKMDTQINRQMDTHTKSDTKQLFSFKL